MKINEDFNESIFDFKVLMHIFQKWPYYLASLCLGIMIIIVYNYKATPIYKMSINLLINEKLEKGLDAESNMGMPILSALSIISLNNEMNIINSKTLIEKTIRKLPFEIDYFKFDKYKTQSLFLDAPFHVIFDSSHVQPLNSKFEISYFTKDKIRIKVSADNTPLYSYKDSRIVRNVKMINIDTIIDLNKKITTNNFSFIISPSQILNNSELNNKYAFVFRSYQSIISEFKNIELEQLSKSTIISVTIKGTNPKKLSYFLNALSLNYIYREIERKNILLNKVINFVESQLMFITDSLTTSEMEIQGFKQNQKMMNIDYLSTDIMEQISELNHEKSRFIVQRDFYLHLKQKLIDDSSGELIIPSLNDLNDPILQSLINELSILNNEKTEIEYNSIRENPLSGSISLKINEQIKIIQQNINSAIDKYSIRIHEIDNRINKLYASVNKLPETQRKLFGMERKFKLNEAIYNHLMTIRSDMQIKKAANIPTNEILDLVSTDEAIKIKPNISKTGMVIILFSLFIPFLFFYSKTRLYDRILGIDDLADIKDIQIVGSILHNTAKTNCVVIENNNILINESFQSLYTNLQFIEPEKPSKVILISSINKSEGKSFISLNLASSIATFNKKVLLIGCDMRNPSIPDCISKPKDIGLSLLLHQTNSHYKNHIITIGSENLYYLTPGTIPPNPLQLLNNGKMGNLIKELKNEFEYIILDTPPVGIISDALSLASYSDIQLIVVRHNATHKMLLKNKLQNLSQKNFKNMALVINDIPNISNNILPYGYGYGYGYNYTYGYGKKS